MKKLFLLLVPALAFAMTSCEIDNYDAPNAEVHGFFVDSKDNTTLVGTDIQNGNQITVYEQGFASEGAQTWRITNTGEYTNKMVFAAKYRVAFSNTNFYPYEGDEMWDVKPGKNERNFVVTPFLRVINPTITANNGVVTAKFKVEQGKNDPAISLKEVRLFAWSDKWVGNQLKFDIKGSAVQSVNGPVDSSVEYTLTINTKDYPDFFPYNMNYYFRIGVQAKGSGYGTIRHNYSPLVKIEL